MNSRSNDIGLSTRLFTLGLLLVWFVCAHLSTRKELNSPSTSVQRRGLNSDMPADLALQSSSQIGVWLHPFVVDDPAGQQPIGHSVWALDFSKVEHFLWQIELDSNADLVINAETLRVLEQIYKKCPSPLDEVNRARLAYLIRKSLPSDSGIQFAELMMSYLPYRQEQSLALIAINESGYDAQLLLLQSSRADIERRQASYFDASVSQKLFTSSNRSYQFFMQSRLINLRRDLSSAEKLAQMEEIHINYKSQSLTSADD